MALGLAFVSCAERCRGVGQHRIARVVRVADIRRRRSRWQRRTIPQMDVNKTRIEANAAKSVLAVERATSVARDVLKEHVGNER